MAYVRNNWNCGDTISAQKLNNIEDGIEEALECCGDVGYSCTEGYQTLFDENVTTEADGLPSALLTPNVPNVATLTVTFNGTEYSCPKIDVGDGDYAYGAPWVAGNLDFSNYPFGIAYVSGTNETHIYTLLQGTYVLKIESSQDGVIYDGSVITKISGSYEWSTPLIPDASSIKVTFDGVEYICPQICRHEDGSSLYYFYGGYDCNEESDDFSEYPFCFRIANYGDTGYGNIGVELSGEHSLKIEVLGEVVETSECFEKAVRSVASGEGGSAKFVVTTNGSIASATPVEIQQAFDEGKVVELHNVMSGGMYVYQLSMLTDSSAKFVYVEASGDSAITLYEISIDSNGAVTNTIITAR